MAKALTDSSFNEGVLKGYTLVDFWAEWCTPCKMIAQFVEELATEWKDKVEVAKLNVDENPEITEKYGVQGIPTLILFKDGEIVDRIIGAAPKSAMVDFLTDNYKA